MSLEQRVYSILVVSAAEHFNSSLQGILPDARFRPICVEHSVSAARQTLSERSFDFTVVNSPLPDEAGTRFSIDICSERGGIALLLVKNELYSAAFDKAAEHGVYLLPKPTTKAMVLQAFDWMIAARERLRKLEKKTVSLEEKMQEIRIVNRAKWLLIERLSMSEGDAHRCIEKQAMDTCVSRREVAENIIKAYS